MKERPILFSAPMVHRASFACLWDDINGADSWHDWKSNPWVWVVKFEVMK